MTPSEHEEYYLHRMLASLHASYVKAAEPYVKRLCEINAMTLRPHTIQVERDMSFDFLLEQAGIIERKPPEPMK